MVACEIDCIAATAFDFDCDNVSIWWRRWISKQDSLPSSEDDDDVDDDSFFFLEEDDLEFDFDLVDLLFLQEEREVSERKDGIKVRKNVQKKIEYNNTRQ